MSRVNTNIEMEMLYTVNISKGVFTHPVLSILKVKQKTEGTYYILLQHKRSKYPSKSDLLKEVCVGADYIGERYNLQDLEPLIQSLRSWQENKNRKLVSYTYLYAYCKSLGKDLHKDYKVM